MVDWVPTGLLAALFALVLKLWRDYHKLDKRIGDIEKEKEIRQEIRMEQLLERAFIKGGSNEREE